MTRRVLALAVTTALILAFFGLAAGTGAQDDNDDFDDLQATSAAHEEELAAVETEIAELEERLAAVETAVASATDEPTEAADGFATPDSEDVLYEADATGGLDEWTGSADWLHRDGQLINDGSAKATLIVAPYEPGSVSDYAVEAEISLVRCATRDDFTTVPQQFPRETPRGNGGFGLIARAEERGAYWAGENCREPDNDANDNVQIWAADQDGAFDSLAEQEHTVDAEWHTYRMEVRGDVIRLLVDGEPLLETRDVRYIGGGQVGLWSSLSQISVRSFRVLAL